MTERHLSVITLIPNFNFRICSELLVLLIVRTYIATFSWELCKDAGVVPFPVDFYCSHYGRGV